MRHRANRSGERPPHQVWTLVLASLGLFMTALDTLVVTTALPVLRTDLGASLADLEVDGQRLQPVLRMPPSDRRRAR